MTEIRPAVPNKTRAASRGHFLRHFLEMVVAMVIGMLVLGPVSDLVLAGLGWSGLFARPDMSALVMTTNMTIGMSLWMRIRGHGWPAIAAMASAMYVPCVVLFVPYWLGALSGAALLGASHVLMLPCMVGVMLRHQPARREGDDGGRAA